MSRGLIRSLLVAVLATRAIVSGSSSAAPAIDAVPQALQRFLSNDNPSPVAYRALRHMEARNDRFDRSAWMDVWTESDAAGGFTYAVAAEGGSDYIRDKVFLASLKAEQKMWQTGAPGRAALTPENYIFDEPAEADGLFSFAVTARRKDVLLIDGSIFFRSEDGELMRIEGRLSRAPSFWIRQVHIVRRYQRIGGERMPVALESVANIRFAGQSTFRMTYEYETLNGQAVGTPALRLVAAEP